MVNLVNTYNCRGGLTNHLTDTQTPLHQLCCETETITMAILFPFSAGFTEHVHALVPLTQTVSVPSQRCSDSQSNVTPPSWVESLCPCHLHSLHWAGCDAQSCPGYDHVRGDHPAYFPDTSVQFSNPMLTVSIYLWTWTSCFLTSIKSQTSSTLVFLAAAAFCRGYAWDKIDFRDRNSI